MTPPQAKDKIISQMSEYGIYLQSDGNGILHTYQLYALCKYHNILTADDIPRFQKALDSLIRTSDNTPTGEKIYGLYNRIPFNINPPVNSHDNYLPTAAAVVIDPSFAAIPAQIDDYATKYYRFFDNINPGKLWDFECWALGFTIFSFRLCANRYPGIINTIWFYITVIFNYLGEGASPSSTSEKLLNQIRMQICYKKWYMRPLYWYYLWQSNKQYPQGLQQMYAIYFGTDSPLTALAQGLSFDFDNPIQAK